MHIFLRVSGIFSFMSQKEAMNAELRHLSHQTARYTRERTAVEGSWNGDKGINRKVENSTDMRRDDVKQPSRDCAI